MCTFQLVLLKCRLKTAFHSVLFSIRILFIGIFFICRYFFFLISFICILFYYYSFETYNKDVNLTWYLCNITWCRCKCNLIMEAVISESLFEKQKSSFDMLNRNWVFILLFSDIILSLLISIGFTYRQLSLWVIVIIIIVVIISEQ